MLGCSITLADIRITQGRLTDALRTYQDALRLAEDDPLPVTRGTADMHVGISRSRGNATTWPPRPTTCS